MNTSATGMPHADPHEVAAIGAEVQRLVRRYPDTPNWFWIGFLIFNFLLIVPVVFSLIYVCVLFKINPVSSLVLGVPLWLGIFMFLRQCMFWRRQSKVEAFLKEFNAAFPEKKSHTIAVTCLCALKDEENEVWVLAKERLAGTSAQTKISTELAVGGTWQAGVGLERVGDPRIDAQVGQWLSDLNSRLTVLSYIHYIFGLLPPGIYFIAMCIEYPRMTSGDLLWGTFGLLAVWNFILLFIMSFIETPIVVSVAARFSEHYPVGSPERDIAIAAFSRVEGCLRAKPKLRTQLTEDAEDETEIQRSTTRQNQKNRTQPLEQRSASTPAVETDTAQMPKTTEQFHNGKTNGPQIVLEPFSPSSLSSASTLSAMSVPTPRAAPIELSSVPALFENQKNQKNFCSSCGKPLLPNNQFCVHCGTKI